MPARTILAAAAVLAALPLFAQENPSSAARALAAQASTAKLVRFSCRPAADLPANQAAYYSLTGELDLGNQALTTSRTGFASERIKLERGSSPVDERCGQTALPLADNLDYYVTLRHYW